MTGGMGTITRAAIRVEVTEGRDLGVPTVHDASVLTAPPTTCPLCGFDWTMDYDSAIARVLEGPARYAQAFAGRDGPRHMADGSFSPREHLWYAVDVLRYGTERLWTLSLDPDAGVMPWHPRDVVTVRRASPMSVRVGLWALTVAAGDWGRAARDAPADLSAWHDDHGWMDRVLMVRRDAHEVAHRELEIRRMLPATT